MIMVNNDENINDEDDNVINYFIRTPHYLYDVRNVSAEVYYF